MSSALIFVVLFSAIVSGTILLFYHTAMSITDTQTDFEDSIKFALICIPFAATFSYCEAICRLLHRKFSFLILNLGYTFGIALSVFFGLVYFTQNLSGLICNYALVWCVFSILGIYFIGDKLQFRFRLPSSELFTYGVPICLSSVVISFSPLLERTILATELSVFDMGIYSAGAKIAMVYLIPINAFQIAFLPYVMERFSNEGFITDLMQVLFVFSSILLFGLLFVGWFSTEIITILASKKFIDGSGYVVPLMFGFMLQYISGTLGIGTLLGKKTHYRLLIQVLTLLFLFILMKYSVPIFGVSGVIYSIIIVRLLIMPLEGYLAQRVYFLNWDYKQILFLLIYVTVFYTILDWSTTQNKFPREIAVLLLVANAIFMYLALTKKGKIFDITQKVKNS